MEEQKFEQWAIVELFGHTKISGKVSEQSIGGCSFLRVDVPKTENDQAFTRLYGNGAIYSIIFVDEETAKYAAKNCNPPPIDVWNARKMLASYQEKINFKNEDEDEDEDED